MIILTTRHEEKFNKVIKIVILNDKEGFRKLKNIGVLLNAMGELDWEARFSRYQDGSSERHPDDQVKFLFVF